MAKLADAADLKSADPKGLWGFKSPSRHHPSALQPPRLPSAFRVTTTSDHIPSVRIILVKNCPLAALTALVVLCLLAALGCGQFFPSSTTITALSIAPTNSTLAPGVTQQFTATATYGNNTTGDVTKNVSWSTTPTNIATVNATGLVSGLALGTATVQAQSGSVIASTSVTVATKAISSIAIQPLTQTLSLSLGPTTVQFTATATYRDGTTGDVTTTSTWNALPSAVASISNTGLATASAVGTSTVTATANGVTSNSATITVLQ